MPSELEIEKGIVLCEKDGDLVAVAHTQYFLYKIGDGHVYCSLSPDVAVKSEYRGQGIFTKMRDLREEVRISQGVKINLGYSENPILVARGRRHNTPEFPFNLKTYVRIRDIDLHLRHNEEEAGLIKKLGFTTLKALNSVAHLMADRRKAHDSFEITRFDEKIDEFWRTVQEDYDFIRQLDKEFLNWRYLDPRGSGNIVRVVLDDEIVLGYVVLAVNEIDPEYPVGVIVDLHSLRGGDDVIDSLLSDSIEYFDERGVNIIKCRTVSGHSQERMLSRHGFLDSRVKPRMTIREMTPHDLSGLYNSLPTRVHVSYGTFDTL